VLAVAVLATALHGCAPDFGSPPAAQIGVTRSKGGDIIVVVPPCAPKVTVISLYVLTGTKALWQAKSTKPRKVQYAVLGTPPLDFATKDAPPHLPVPTARLRLKVTFGSPVTDTTTTGSTTTTTTTTVTAAAGASTPGTAAPGDAAPTDTNEISSEVLFRQNQLAQGRVLLDDELVTVEQFTKRTCKKTPR
jgi:hypothetical protein